MHTIQKKTPVKIKYHLQFNTSNPIEDVQKAIAKVHDRHIDEGEAIMPGYAVTGLIAVIAVLERLLHDLDSGKVTPQTLRYCADKYDEEDYARGAHFYIRDEAAKNIPRIAYHIAEINPDLRRYVINSKRDVIGKGVASIAVYYVYHLLGLDK